MRPLILLAALLAALSSSAIAEARPPAHPHLGVADGRAAIRKGSELDAKLIEAKKGFSITSCAQARHRRDVIRCTVTFHDMNPEKTGFELGPGPWDMTVVQAAKRLDRTHIRVWWPGWEGVRVVRP